jgi:hypothetical protein
MFELVHVDIDDLVTAKAVAASQSFTSSIVPITHLTKLHVYVKNTGTSTTATLTVYASKDKDGNMSGALQAFTLGAGNITPTKSWVPVEWSSIPAFVYVVLSNTDVANGAIYTVSLDGWR